MVKEHNFKMADFILSDDRIVLRKPLETMPNAFYLSMFGGDYQDIYKLKREDDNRGAYYQSQKTDMIAYIPRDNS